MKTIKPPPLKPEVGAQEVLDRQPETVVAQLGKDSQVHCSIEKMGGGRKGWTRMGGGKVGEGSRWSKGKNICERILVIDIKHKKI